MMKINMVINDLNPFFSLTFVDCFQAANYLRVLHGKRTVNIDVSIRDLANDENLINWYLIKLGYEWTDLAIAIVNRHIVTLMTVDNQKVLLGVTKINGELKGTMYNRHLLHYPIYSVRNTERYCHEKFKKSYALS